MKMIEKECQDIMIEKANNNIITLGFSMGKDSLSCALILRNMGVKFIPYYFYHVPNIQFIEDNLRRYEDFFKVQINRYPHPIFYDKIRFNQHVDPNCIIPFNDEFNVCRITFEEIKTNDLFYDKKYSIEKSEKHYTVVGLKKVDSFTRRQALNKCKFINEEKRNIYPIKDWLKNDCFQYIKDNGCFLPSDYEIFPISFDGLSYRFLYKIKEIYPNDYKTIKDFFPLIDVEFKKYEYNKKYFI